MSPLHHKAAKQKMLMGIWRVTGSTQLQNLAVRGLIAFSGAPSGNKLVTKIHISKGLKSVSKFDGTLVDKSHTPGKKTKVKTTPSKTRTFLKPWRSTFCSCPLRTRVSTARSTICVQWMVNARTCKEEAGCLHIPKQWFGQCHVPFLLEGVKPQGMTLDRNRVQAVPKPDISRVTQCLVNMSSGPSSCLQPLMMNDCDDGGGSSDDIGDDDRFLKTARERLGCICMVRRQQKLYFMKWMLFCESTLFGQEAGPRGPFAAFEWCEQNP
eukprot:1160253-Pelagomonas_calceolata.AAC.6